MSVIRRILTVGEEGFRRKQVQERLFLSQESNLPMYVRKKSDGLPFAASLLLGAGSFACTVVLIKDFIV
ncbi:hypothetical protein HDV04_002445 [Boothiomyces sp. JEL0838]|nr:hypothetical protein HDV04_002445 [Boothiomyces sp. JEL0838]